MANAPTHDKITLLIAAVTLPVTLKYTQSIDLALWAGGGAFFSGWMFGPDLDHRTDSKPLQRWGPLRPIWYPYRKILIPRHRHPLSHCPVLGTVVRCLYLLFWFTMLLALAVQVGPFLNFEIGSLDDAIAYFQGLANEYRLELIWLFIGLAVGDIGHIMADYMPKPRLKAKTETLEERHEHHESNRSQERH